MYSGGPPHKPYFIAFILQEQIIISPTKKMVALYMARDLALLDQVHGDMNIEMGVLLQLIPYI